VQDLCILFVAMYESCFSVRNSARLNQWRNLARFNQWINPARFNQWRNSARFNLKPMKPWNIHGCINWHVQGYETCSTLLLF
jgi:hypothetical protein